MKKRAIRIGLAVLGGVAAGVLAIALLARLLTDGEILFQGRNLAAWRSDLASPNAAVSNAAYGTVTGQVIPEILRAMREDQTDSVVRATLVGWLNRLPGVDIQFVPAEGRRSYAAGSLGDLGPVAAGAVPALLAAVAGRDEAVRNTALLSLGRIGCDPDHVLPVLQKCLGDKELRAEAANALGHFGPLAKDSLPTLIVLANIKKDKETRAEAAKAVKLIDPAAAAAAGIK